MDQANLKQLLESFKMQQKILNIIIIINCLIFLCTEKSKLYIKLIRKCINKIKDIDTTWYL